MDLTQHAVQTLQKTRSPAQNHPSQQLHQYPIPGHVYEAQPWLRFVHKSTKLYLDGESHLLLSPSAMPVGTPKLLFSKRRHFSYSLHISSGRSMSQLKRGKCLFVWARGAAVVAEARRSRRIVPARPVFAAAIAALNAKAAGLSGTAQPGRNTVPLPPIPEKSKVSSKPRVEGERRPRGREQPPPGEIFPKKPELCSPTLPVSRPRPRTCRREFRPGCETFSCRQRLCRDWRFRLHRRRGRRQRRLRAGST